MRSKQIFIGISIAVEELSVSLLLALPLSRTAASHMCHRGVCRITTVANDAVLVKLTKPVSATPDLTEEEEEELCSPASKRQKLVCQLSLFAGDEPHSVHKGSQIQRICAECTRLSHKPEVTEMAMSSS